MLKEIIVCSKCKGEDCTVEHIFETERVDMEEYARRHTFPENVYDMATAGRHTIRRILITCQDCGYQYEFTERPLRSVSIFQDPPSRSTPPIKLTDLP